MDLFYSINIYYKILVIYILIINLTSYLLMGMDKGKAIKKKYRIRESLFIIFALLGGSIGILLGMITFKHKINKRKFSIGIPLIYILNKITTIIISYYIYKL